MKWINSLDDIRRIDGSDFDGRWLGAPTLPLTLLAPLMAAPLAMAVVDEEGMVIGWNEFATGLLGWTPRDIIGTKVEDHVIPHRFVDDYLDLLAERPIDDPRVATRCFTLPLRSKDGHEVILDIALASTVDLGHIFYVVYAWESAGDRPGATNDCDAIPAAATIHDFRTHKSIGAGQLARFAADRKATRSDGVRSVFQS